MDIASTLEYGTLIYIRVAVAQEGTMMRMKGHGLQQAGALKTPCSSRLTGDDERG
jgi:hypothetical protein